MEILTNDNNEYFGLATDYKNGNAFRDAIVADGAEGKIAIIAMIHMRPLTDHELSEEGEYSTYDPGHWIPCVSCETSDVFYHAIETDIPVLVNVEEELKEDYPHLTEDQIAEAALNVELLEEASAGDDLFEDSMEDVKKIDDYYDNYGKTDEEE